MGSTLFPYRSVFSSGDRMYRDYARDRVYKKKKTVVADNFPDSELWLGDTHMEWIFESAAIDCVGSVGHKVLYRKEWDYTDIVVPDLGLHGYIQCD